jgi:MoaA/NifB/PqqE/SkfB family radical SAM enzyme
MKTYWLRIYHHISKIHKEVDVAFTGGEVTINKNFLPFIKWLTTHFNDILCNIYVTSNGSASTQYYVDLNKYITHLTLSTHMEFINENKFFGTLLKLNNINKSINSSEKLYVQVMEETFYDADKIKVYESFMIMHSIPYIIVEIT